MEELVLGSLVVLLSSAALNAAFNDLLAAALSKVPNVGPQLAEVSRALNPLFQRWLLQVVKVHAEAAVQEVEGDPIPMHNEVKKREAVKKLTAAAPGLNVHRAADEVENALQRIKGAAKLAERAIR